MENCLVTKLKGVVNNESLAKFGYLMVHVQIPEEPIEGRTFIRFSCLPNSDREKFPFFLSDPSKCFYEGGTKLTNVLKTNNLTANIKDPGNYYVCIPKYQITEIYNTTQYLVELIDLGDVKYSPLTKISNQTTYVAFKGDIANLSGKDMTSIDFNRQSDVYGNFSEVCGGMINLTDFNFGGTKVIGSIEKFVQNQRAAGRTTYTFGSGTLMYLGAAKGITFQGSSIQNQANNSLSWDATTITFNGETITA